MVCLIAAGMAMFTILGASAGIRCSMRTMGTPIGEVLRQVVALVGQGRYDVNVDVTFPLEQTAEARARSQTGRTRGKIIMRVSAP